MKKLNLLAPDEHNEFLIGRGREKVRYLQIPSGLNRAKLAEDVKNGALYFENVKKQADRRPSRTVVIRTDNEETGLMALTYLAAAYNEMDENGIEECDNEDLVTEIGEDYFMTEGFSYEECVEDDEEESHGPEDAGEWCETMYKLPLLKITDVRQVWYNENSNIFINNGFGMQGQNNERERSPWWFSCRKEPVCIIVHAGACIFGDFGRSVYELFSEEGAAHFPDNRHI